LSEDECYEDMECNKLYKMHSTVNHVYALNLADLVFCWLAVPLSFLVLFTCCLNYGDEKRGAIFLFTCIMLLFWVVDFGLEIGMLADVFSGARGAAEDMKSATCMSAEGTEILVEFAEDMKQVQTLGFFQLGLSFLGVGVDCGLAFLGDKLADNGESAEPTGIITHSISVVEFQIVLVEAVLATVDFAVFTADAKNKVDQLFDALKQDGGAHDIVWCFGEVKLDETKTPCIEASSAKVQASPIVLTMLAAWWTLRCNV